MPKKTVADLESEIQSLREKLAHAKGKNDALSTILKTSLKVDQEKVELPAEPLRGQPNEIEIEKALFSAIFINNDTLFDVLGVLKNEDFYKPAHKKIYRAIQELFNAEEPTDLVTVANLLNKKGELENVGGPAYLTDISDCAPDSSNAVHYAKTIQEKSLLRQLLKVSSQVMGKCMKDSETPIEIIKFAESSVFRVAEKRFRGIGKNVGELINDTIDQLEEQQGKKGGLAGLSTGYSRLDQITSGLQSSDFIILAARPSMGKTSLSLNIARNVAFGERKSVAVFSLEMGYSQISMRLLTSEARIDSYRLRTDSISPEDWQNFCDAAGLLNELPLTVDDTPNISVGEIRTKAQILQRRYGDLGLVIVDYLQLIKPSIKNENRRDLEIQSITADLKALAKDLRVPVIALSQLNRHLEQRSDKRPIMSDLRESGAIEQDADIIMFIYRDEIYNKEPDNPKKGTAEVIVAKNRNGAVGTSHMLFNGQYTRFEELAPEAYQGFK